MSRHRADESPPESSRIAGLVVTGAALAGVAVVARLWYVNYVVNVPTGFAAVVYSNTRRTVHRVIRNTTGGSWASRYCVLPLCDKDAAVMMLPATVLIDATEAAAEGCPVTVLTTDVLAGSHPQPLKCRVSVTFGVRVAELNRFLTIHGSSPPQAAIGEAVSDAVRRTVQSLGEIDPEALLSTGRRERCFDDKAVTAIRDAVWLAASARCLRVRIEGFTTDEK
jgi:hypothetical protein